MSRETIHYKDGHSISYEIDHDDVLCQYIRQVDQILKNDNEVLINTLDTIIDNYISDIKLIKEDINNALNMINSCNSMGQVLRVATKLSNNHRTYVKLIKIITQVDSLNFENFNEHDKYNLKSIVEADKETLKEQIVLTNKAFQVFFDECNEKFHNITPKQKELLRKLILQVKLNNGKIDENILEITNEGIIIDTLSTVGRVLLFPFKYFKSILHVVGGIFGVMILSDNEGVLKFIDNTLGEGFASIASSITIILIVYLVSSASYYLYNIISKEYNEYKLRDLNAQLNELKNKSYNDDNRYNKLPDDTPFEQDDTIDNSINIPTFNNKLPEPTINVDAVNADVDPNDKDPNIFSGFGNQKGYRPTKKDKENDKFDIF